MLLIRVIVLGETFAKIITQTVMSEFKFASIKRFSASEILGYFAIKCSIIVVDENRP